MEAIVVKNADEGHVWLDIDGTSIRAKAPADVPAGAKLLLRVKKLGARVMMDIVGPRFADTAPLQSAIRGLLPRQNRLTPLLANLTYLTGPAQSGSASTPSEVTTAARQLLDSVPFATRLGFADALQATLKDSGIFLEARLARAARGGPPPALHADFKAALLRFVRTLNALQTPAAARNEPPPPPPNADYPPLRRMPLHPQPRAPASLAPTMPDAAAVSEVKHQINASLARIQLLQLSAHPADSNGACWLFELPMRHNDGIDLWQLRLEREPEEGAGKKQSSTWTANLSFSLDNLGPVHARISIRGAKVSTLFRAERAATADLYSRALDELAALYQAHGLGVGALACHVGEPHAGPPQRSGVLDLRA